MAKYKKTNCPQQGVWRQAGRCLVGHFAGFWEFTTRPSLCETPPDAKPQTRCVQPRAMLPITLNTIKNDYICKILKTQEYEN